MLNGIRLINKAKAKSNDNDITDVKANTVGAKWIRSMLIALVKEIWTKKHFA
jgi:hypothetical protein